MTQHYLSRIWEEDRSFRRQLAREARRIIGLNLSPRSSRKLEPIELAVSDKILREFPGATKLPKTVRDSHRSKQHDLHLHVDVGQHLNLQECRTERCVVIEFKSQAKSFNKNINNRIEEIVGQKELLEKTCHEPRESNPQQVPPPGSLTPRFRKFGYVMLVISDDVTNFKKIKEANDLALELGILDASLTFGLRPSADKAIFTSYVQRSSPEGFLSDLLRPS